MYRFYVYVSAVERVKKGKSIYLYGFLPVRRHNSDDDNNNLYVIRRGGRGERVEWVKTLLPGVFTRSCHMAGAVPTYNNNNNITYARVYLSDTRVHNGLFTMRSSWG